MAGALLPLPVHCTIFFAFTLLLRISAHVHPFLQEMLARGKTALTPYSGTGAVRLLDSNWRTFQVG